MEHNYFFSLSTTCTPIRPPSPVRLPLRSANPRPRDAPRSARSPLHPPVSLSRARLHAAAAAAARSALPTLRNRPTDAVAAAHLDGGDGEQCNEYYRAAVDDGNTTEDDDTTANVPNPCSERGRERRISGGPDRKRERQTDCAAA